MGWASSTRRGGGQKLRALPRKFVFLGFRREEPGTSREFCQDVPDPWGCSKSLCLKSSCAFFVPYLRRAPSICSAPKSGTSHNRQAEVKAGSCVAQERHAKVHRAPHFEALPLLHAIRERKIKGNKRDKLKGCRISPIFADFRFSGKCSISRQPVDPVAGDPVRQDNDKI